MNLYVVTNIFIFMEELSTLGVDNDTYFTIDSRYVKSRNVKRKLIEDVFKLVGSIKYIDYYKISNYKWNIVICSSYQHEDTYKKLLTVKCNKFILVEDGSYDYFNTTVVHPEFTRDKDLFIFKPDSSRVRQFYKSVNKLSLSNDLQNKVLALYRNELNRFSSFPKTTPIFFTSPLVEDFQVKGVEEKIVAFLEKCYSGQTVILKKHPRDLCSYKSSKVNIVECERNIPGQLLDLMFDGYKIFSFPSTICFMSNKVKSMIILRLSSNNKRYCDYYTEVYNVYPFKVIDL